MTQPEVAPIDNPVNTSTLSTKDGSIVTRFGDLAVDPDKIISFDQGLYGLEHHRRFLLTEVPGWPDFFKLLQAVDDPQPQPDRVAARRWQRADRSSRFRRGL